MSFKVTSLVWDRSANRAPALHMLVLLLLADRADDAGFAYPSIEGMAQELEVGQTSIRRALHALIASGEVRIDTPSAGGRGRSNVYRIDIALLRSQSPRRAGQTLPPLAGIRAPKPSRERQGYEQQTLPLVAQNPAAGGAETLPPAAPQPINEPIKNRSGHRLPPMTGTRATKRAPTTAGKACLPECPCKDLVALYHEHLPELPRVMTIGPERKKKLHQLWRWMLTERKLSDLQPRAANAEEALAYAGAFFAQARRDDFIMGRRPPGKGHEGWRADLDYLLSEKGISRVLEKADDD
ncbi:MAG: hypothetical protein J7605_17245 [Variovorax sp.]|nr:hypothetical protein [Variovorax sp.]